MANRDQANKITKIYHPNPQGEGLSTTIDFIQEMNQLAVSPAKPVHTGLCPDLQDSVSEPLSRLAPAHTGSVNPGQARY